MLKIFILEKVLFKFSAEAMKISGNMRKRTDKKEVSK